LYSTLGVSPPEQVMLAGESVDGLESYVAHIAVEVDTTVSPMMMMMMRRRRRRRRRVMMMMMMRRRRRRGIMMSMMTASCIGLTSTWPQMHKVT
jgi:hypothetical protein